MTTAKTKDDPTLHTRFISVVPLEKPGVLEFTAWEKATWMGIWMKPFNVKSEIAHLIFCDCPTARQITFRFLFLEGQAQLPVDPDEEWSAIGLPTWPTRRSFGTLWLSKNCFSKTEEPKRGRLPARQVETNPITEPPIEAPEEFDASIP